MSSHTWKFVTHFLALLCGLANASEDYSFCTIPEANQTNISALECLSDATQKCLCNSAPLKDIESNTIVIACKKSYSLQFTINLEDVDNTGIIGQPGGTAFNCSSKGGLKVSHSKNVSFQRITFTNCETQFFRERSETTQEDNIQLIRAAIIFYNTSGINFQNIHINAYTSGAVLINSQGLLSNSIFECHSESEKEIVGGTGLHVEYDNEYYYSAIKIQITNCTFEGNKAKRSDNTLVTCDTNETILIGSRGGGIALYLRSREAVEKTLVQIHNCTFKSNYALFGGGMYLLMCATKKTTNVVISDSKFLYNIAKHGGGGLDINLKDSLSNITRRGHHSCDCNTCLFYGNKAYFGAGSAFYTTEVSKRIFVTFNNSTWLKNEGVYGMAFDLKTDGLIEQKSKIIITLVNASFEQNIFPENRTLISSTRRDVCHVNKIARKGVLLVSELNVVFEGIINFRFNKDSAVYAVASLLKFVSHTKATFEGNEGVAGAGIALIGTAALQVHYNVTFQMLNNTASSMGGAIFHESFNKHDYILSRSCFIQLPHGYTRQKFETGILFNFSGNRARSSYDGDTIFATTFLPCLHYCKVEETSNNITNIFGCIGNFNYHDKMMTNALSTRAACIIPEKITNLNLIPGFTYPLNFKNVNDLYHEVQGIYHITSSDPSKVIVDESSTYTAIKAVVVKGKPGDSANITITNVDVREAAITYHVLLHSCPPLFLYNPDTGICECYSGKSMHRSYRYICDERNEYAKLIHGYWLGTLSYSDEELYSGYCPLTYCYRGSEHERYHMMPSNVKDLDEDICSNSGRTGTLCGSCKENLSVHYHSDSFVCGGEEMCSYGWLLYIISEIIPLTIMFFLIMSFKISLTSGHLNGFLFFAQTYDSLFLIGKSFVYYPIPAYHLVNTIHTIYKFFNLDFLANDAMSFCLWSGATTLHMLAFKYVTVTIAFLLVFITVVILNKLPLFNKTLRYTPGTSTIHGLSTFLILVYMQGTKISFDILRYTRVNKLNGTNQTLVVFFQGNTQVLSDEHKPFAAIAVLFMIFITFLPPFLLIVYPLCYKVSLFFRIKNTRVFLWFSKIPVFRLKPMFDAFQGTFKDQYRYFAGLYFGYRILLLLATFAPRISQAYIIIQIELVLMLVIHLICCPYIKRAHNITDAIILGDLSIVSILSLLNFMYSIYGSSFQSMINIVSYLVVLLLSLPLICLCCNVIIWLYKQCLKKSKSRISIPDDGEILLNRIDDRDDGETFDYKNFSLD